jgi:hypothetical protein
MILGVLCAVAITKTDLTPQSAVIRWLVYCVVAGALINTQRGESVTCLLLSSAMSASVVLLCILWISLIGSGELPITVSGRKLQFDQSHIQYNTMVLGGLWALSVSGVLVCTYSRPAVLTLLGQVESISTARAENLENLLKITVSIAGSLGLLVAALL